MPPTSGAPTAADDAILALGQGVVTLTSPIELTADAQSLSLTNTGGQPTIDLAGFDYAIGAQLSVFPAVVNDAPALTITNGSIDPSTLTAPLVEVANGGVLNLTGDVTLTSTRSSVGVTDPDFAAAALASPSTATLSGGTWTASERFDVGASGDGSVTVSAGGTLALVNPTDAQSGVYLGSNAATTGTLVVEDAGSSLEAPLLVVGGKGSGSVEVRDGASLSAERVELGQSSTSDGSLRLLGAGTQATLSSISVGQYTGAQGSLEIDGADVSIGALYAGRGADSILTFDSGTLTLNYADVNTATPQVIGDGSNPATLNLQGGSTFAVGLSVANHAEVNQSGTFNTPAQVSIDDGGRFQQISGSFTADTVSTSGSGAFEFQGGRVNLGSDVGVGQGHLLGDPLVLTSGATTNALHVDGTLTIDGDQTLTPADPGGAVTVQDGGDLEAQRIVLANGGQFDYQGGRLALTGTEVGDGLTIATGGLMEDVTLGPGDELDVAATTSVVDRVVSVTAGGTLSTGGLDVQTANGGRVDFVAGELTVDGALRVGGSGGVTGAGGASSVSVGAASLFSTADQLTLSSGAGLNLTGGSVQMDSLVVEAGSTGLNWSSGTVHFVDSVDTSVSGLYSAPFTLDAGKLLRVEQVGAGLPAALTVSGQALTIDGGKLDVEDLIIDANSGGAVYFAGGELQVDFDVEIGGSTGIQGVGGSQIVLGYGDRIGNGADNLSMVGAHFAGGQSIRVETGGTLQLDVASMGGGSFIEFAGGWAFLDNIDIGPGGLVGVGGAVTLGAGDELRVQDPDDGVSISGHTVVVDGGNFRVDSLVAAGTALDFRAGSVTFDDQDVFLGSSYGPAVDGFRFETNATQAGDAFFTLHDGMGLNVFGTHTTHVDGSVLRIESGGALQTYELDAGALGINVVVDPGGILYVHHFGVTSDVNLTGDLIAEEVEIASNLTLSPGARILGNAILQAGGTLLGNGTVEGDVTSQGGALSPGESPGTITIGGNLTLDDQSSILIEVGKNLSTQELVHDVLAVSGTAVVDGTLDLAVDLSGALDPGFDPVAEDVSFTFLTAGAVQGSFADVLGRSLGGGYVWGLSYFADSIVVSVEQDGFVDQDFRLISSIPEPSTALLVALGLAVMGGRTRLRSRARVSAR